jgi:hypothetical protein
MNAPWRTWGAAALLLLILGLVVSRTQAADVVTPLPNAHAHNDYLHPRPLLDALDQGFCSVEADIYLVEGKLLVAHNREDVRPERTLEVLYLEPLKHRVRVNKGRVFRDGPGFTLLIDVKDEAEPTYRVLRGVLQKYEAMLTHYDGDQATRGAISIVLSGNRPRALLEAEKSRLATLDGRLADLGKGASPALVSLVSDNWQLAFTWRGTGAIPPAERDRLADLVRRAHAEGYRLRFWATPDTPTAWAELRQAGVDLINTDDLPGLAAFLRTPPKN